jgi:hypothetical protein
MYQTKSSLVLQLIIHHLRRSKSKTAASGYESETTGNREKINITLAGCTASLYIPHRIAYGGESNRSPGTFVARKLLVG